MKFKIIFLLSVLLTGGLSATPNKCGKGVSKRAPVSKVVMMIDEAELLPLQYFLRNF